MFLLDRLDFIWSALKTHDMRGSSVLRILRASVKAKTLAIPDSRDLLFGHAPNPLALRSGMVLGGGTVYPELNFTLPTMEIRSETMPAVLAQYKEMVSGALKRAVELEIPGLVLEFETLPPMTENPQWGLDVAQLLMDALADAEAKHGLKSTFRMTPNDVREMERPPLMRSGPLFDAMLELFDRSAEAGAELLSIESVGGKEVHDEALTYGSVEQSLFGLCVLGARDMRFLWTHLVEIADRHHAVPAGDTACGFANTAMVLAEQHLIPSVFAAVVRAMSAVRSLVAYECGARGPGKDCGYENVILKAITGFPMAMEGKTAACAHPSPVGNVAGAACDTWSNESVQNVKLLGGMAPTCYMEQLAYDCRLFNRALADGPEGARQLRDWLSDSDACLDPHALILTPESAVAIGQAIVDAPNDYLAGRAAGLTAIRLIEEAVASGRLKLKDRETPWLDTMRDSLEELPDDESTFIARMMSEVDVTRFRPEDYEIA